MNSMRNYTHERAGTFADHREREDVALDFWHACQRAAEREQMEIETATHLCRTCGGDLKHGPICGQCG
jgi:hypothetical protein